MQGTRLIPLIDPKGKGVSHHERTMQKEGKSWKDKLRIRIAEVMLYSRDFADFLKNCTASGIEYVYTPQNKVKLKFKLSGDGQQRFTRADTLGADYTAERITEQIAEIQEKLSAANVTPEMLIEPPMPVEVPKTEPKPTPTELLLPRKNFLHRYMISRHHKHPSQLKVKHLKRKKMRGKASGVCVTATRSLQSLKLSA